MAQAEWIITSVAGTGEQGYAGDGGAATQALLNNPFDLAFDPSGSLCFSDTFNHCIRRIDAKTGVITTIAGTGERGFAGDGGPATKAQFNEPYGIVIDRTGAIYIADRLNKCVRRIATDGTISTLAGDPELKEPNGLALDRDHRRLFIADVADHRVRVVDLASGTLATFAGTGEAAHSGDGGPATAAGIFGARAVALAPDDSLYIQERQGSSLRRVRNGTIETIAGTPGVRGYAGDNGDARQAVFAAPKELALDPAGNIFIVDTENHAIRMIDAKSHIVRTIAGGRAGPEGDGGPADQAGLARPHGAVVGPDGAIYIGDSENHRIRKLTRTN